VSIDKVPALVGYSRRCDSPFDDQASPSCARGVVATNRATVPTTSTWVRLRLHDRQHGQADDRDPPLTFFATRVSVSPGGSHPLP
jgi:hypothetical protein